MPAPLQPNQVFGMPWISPMLAQPYPKPFSDPDYLFELKWDGYRCIAYVTEKNAALYSRNGHPLGQRFPHLGKIYENLRIERAAKAVFDGEIVSFENGRLSFQSVANRPQRAVYVIFDLLFLGDRSLLDLPLEERKYLLSESVEQNERVSISYTAEKEGIAAFEWVKRKNLEGIMAKRKGSRYQPGVRSKDWIKIRNIKEGEFWVIGYLPSPGRKVGSLIIAERLPSDSRDPPFIARGRVGSGLSYEKEKEVSVRLGKTSDEPLFPVLGKLTKIEHEKARWIEPRFKALVHYQEMTPDGRLRHPVFRQIVDGVTP